MQNFIPWFTTVFYDMSLLIVAFLLPSSGSATGADLEIPVNNTTALNTEIVTAWVSSASQRGTGDILYSCTITITLCIFTVLHLNIPAHGERPWKKYLRKVRWMFITLIAPEVVLYTAFTQFQQARTLCKTLNRQVSKLAENSSLPAALSNKVQCSKLLVAVAHP